MGQNSENELEDFCDCFSKDAIDTLLDDIQQSKPKKKKNKEKLIPFHITKESEEVICDTSHLPKMPKHLAKLCAIIERKYPHLRKTCIIALVLLKVMQMFSSKRIQYLEQSKIGLANIFVLLLIPSGAGKDRLSDELDTYVFYLFIEWFQDCLKSYKEDFEAKIREEANREYPDENDVSKREKFVKEKMKEFRTLVREITDATKEGFYEDAKSFMNSFFGSLMLKFSEAGLYLKNLNFEQRQYINLIFEAYSGKIHSKCIKGASRQKCIEGLPVNVLMFSDPTLFKGQQLKEFFENLLEVGLSRRFIITFMNDTKLPDMEKDPKKAFEEEKKYYADLKCIGLKLFTIFVEIEENEDDENPTYKLTEKTYVDVFYPYKINLQKLANNEENSSLKKEIISRELKALKIATLYASINHNNKFTIDPEDMEMAIDTVETLSKDFKKFLNYRPSKNDGYDELFSLFLDNLGVEFNKNTLVTKHYLLTGHSRKFFRDNFDDYIEILSEIAQERGYVLNQRPINNNSGCAYWLSTNTPESLNNATVELDDLL